MRFAIRRDWFWRPLLLLLGASAGRSWLEIGGGELRARYGWFYDRRYPLASIAGAGRRSWPLILGVGWRFTFGGTVGLIGSLRNVVEIRFDRPRRVDETRVLVDRPSGIVFPVRYRRLAVSLENPEEFLAALEETAREAGGWRE